MALIVKTDAGFGSPIDKAYVKLDVNWYQETPELYKASCWEITVKAYLNKQARETEIVKDWIQQRMVDVHVDIMQPLADNPISLKQWNNHLSPGPWSTIEEQGWIERNFVLKKVRPVRQFTRSFEPITLPEFTTQTVAQKLLYKVVTMRDHLLWEMINSLSIDDQEIEDSIENDHETINQVILRVGATFPLLLKKTENEPAVMHGVNLGM